MSIFKGFSNFYYIIDCGTVNLKKFNSFSDLEKGKFLATQYISLIEINSYRIDLHKLYSSTNYIENIYNNTSNLFIKEYVDQLDFYFRTWMNQLNKNDGTNKLLLGIVQWLRGDINLDPSVKISDILFLINSTGNDNLNFVRNTYDNNLTLIIFYYLSKLKNMFKEYHLININNFEEIYPNKTQEISSVNKGVLSIPLYNESYYEENKENYFYYSFCDERVINTTDVSYKNLIFNKDKTIFEIIFNSSVISDSLPLDFLCSIIHRFNLGYDFRANGDEFQLIDFENIICENHKNINLFNLRNNRFVSLIKHLVNNGLINTKNYSGILLNLIKEKTIEEDTSGVESLNLLSKVNKLIYRVTMEDEDVEDDKTEEDDTEENEEDNIDDENIDESEEDTSEDDSNEFDSGSSDDSSYSSSSSGSYGSTEKPPIEVPKNVNANTSSSKGIKLELDVNPTFDTIMVKRELSNLIENLLIDEKLTPKQRVTLEDIKTKWMGLLTSTSLIDWIERTLNRTIFKKS